MGHLHPRVFNETRKWPPFKKEKYKEELELMNKIRATPNLRPTTADEMARLEVLIKAVLDEIGKPIGAADREQIASAIHCSAEIITNDEPFTKVAESLDVEVHTAERVVLEAFYQKVITKTEVITARERWNKNSEKRPSLIDKNELDKIYG